MAPGLSVSALHLIWIVMASMLALAGFTAFAHGTAAAAFLGTWRGWAQLGGAILLLAAIRLAPICLGLNVRATLDGVIAFAAILTFDPLTAMTIAMAGIALHHLVYIIRDRWPWHYLAFNVAQGGLTTGLADLALQNLHGSGPIIFRSGPGLIAVLGAAVVYFCVNTLVVSAMSAAINGRTTWECWEKVYRTGWTRYFAVLFLGVLVAVLYDYQPMVLPLMLIPLLVVHQAFSSAVSLREESRQVLETLADVIARRDAYTSAHSQRVSEYARLTAQRLGLSIPQQDAIALAARVHDLGKISIPDDVLKRPGPLSQNELDEIHRHTVVGAEIVSKLTDFSKSREAILYHHERWDGSGMYRLAYEHIPVGARIIAIADAFDAMASDRPYRPALSPDAALAEIERGKGVQFDPEVTEVFLDVMRTNRVVVPRTAACLKPSTPSRPVQISAVESQRRIQEDAPVPNGIIDGYIAAVRERTNSSVGHNESEGRNP